MQEALSVEKNYCPIRKIAEVGGVRVPWEVAGYREDAEIAASGGFFDCTSWGDVVITGPDARDYLNRMTTVNFKSFASTQAAYGAFLTGRAGVVTLGMFVPGEGESFHYVVAPGQSAPVAEHVEKFHFRENLTVADDSAQWALFALWNAGKKLGFASALPMQITRTRGEYGEALAWADAARPELTWVRLARTAAPAFLAWLRSQAVPLLGQHLFEYHRVKSGMPDVGVEVSDKDLILEANLELAISRNKGCYPGQEVVERIFTYGQVNRKLLPVTVTGELPSLPFVVQSGDKKAGTVVALVENPQTGDAVGLAYVQRAFWESGDAFVTEGGSTQARIIKK